MTPPRLVALCSPCMGSGKSEVAGRLLSWPERNYVGNRPFKLIKFAGPVKAMALALFEPMVGPEEAMRMVEGDLKEVASPVFGTTPRRIMQTLGTEWGRDTVGHHFWVDLARVQAAHWMANGYSVVMDDLRFKNELQMVKDLGGEAYRVIRPAAPAYAPHASEGELDTVPLREIPNLGTLADLHETADLIARGDY